MVWPHFTVFRPGAPSMVAPSNVGIRLGSQGLRSLRVQTHFNNPDMTTEQVDNSGIRVHYTAVGSTRPIEMGVMQVQWLRHFNFNFDPHYFARVHQHRYRSAVSCGTHHAATSC